MVSLFAAANLLIVAGSAKPDLNFFLASIALSFLFFLKLRCFDELKDYEVDLKVNPTRPLARGLLSIAEVRQGILFIILSELAIVGISTGLPGLAIYGLTVAYSLLMFEEFFIGPLIRPHLTTYAVTHTFVAGLWGWALATIFLSLSQDKIVWAPVGLIIYNWLQFNLFEFARKSFAKNEETPNHDSYTSLFGVPKAVLLSLSMVLGSLLVAIYGLPKNPFESGLTPAAIYMAGTALIALTGLLFVFKKDEMSAKKFRLAATLCLVTSYLWILPT
jgi:4-hydroxybenzoate polyprenyltransferase